MKTSCQSRLKSIQLRLLHESLRKLGYSKHGNLYAYRESKLVRVIDLNKSTISSKSEIDFTFDCGVYIPGVIAFYCSKSDSQLSQITDCCIHGRLGLLNEDRRNKWWTIQEDDDDASAADDKVVADITRRLEMDAIPFLNRFRDPEHVIQFLSLPRIGNAARVWPQSDAISFCLAAIVASLHGTPAQAEELIKAAIVKSRKTPVEEVVESVGKRLSRA